MKNNGHNFEIKLIRLLNKNEIDLIELIEFFERSERNLIVFLQNLKPHNSDSTNLPAGNELINFFDLLKKAQRRYPQETKRFTRVTNNQEDKFELMLQNAEKFAWLLELERKKNELK